jgi:HEAT repeat protein
MMCGMLRTVWRTAWRSRKLALYLLVAATSLAPAPALAQLNYVVRFEMEKARYLLGEPIFCEFVIRNTGSQPFAFRYRSPSRVLARDNEQEPHFAVTDSGGRQSLDPAPRPCGGAQGTVVYGSVTLPPGQTHTERWLLNQWARFTMPGRFQVRAERRLALLAPDPQTGKFAEKPAAFALALDELSFEVESSTAAQLEAAFQPYLAAVRNKKDPDPAEAVLVVTTLPQPFFLDQLVAMASSPKPDRWDRRNALDGLARLGTPAAWEAILKVASGAEPSARSGRKDSAGEVEGPVRSYALLLLAEKAEPAFLPTLIEMLAKNPEPVRGDVLRALGFFPDTRAYQILFRNLHSAQVTDRMNAILGLKNSGTKEVIPALLAMLSDPEPAVRQVANFALGGVTGHKIALSGKPSREESARVADLWHAWWREHSGSFSPPPPPTCHEW